MTNITDKRFRIAADSVMAIPARNSSPIQIVSGVRTFHVTSSTSGKRFLLQSDRAAQLFLRVLQDYRAQGKFRLHEFAVMPDHFHVLVTVDADTTVERAVQFIKGGFAFRAGKELGFKAPIWQRGFSEVRLFNAHATMRVCEYIRDNPVVAGMVQQASDYPYSSAYPGCALDPLPQGLKPISFEASGGTAESRALIRTYQASSGTLPSSR
ncbi:MAG: REP-associated tyrosine transposase [Terriglobales bacterium]